MTTAYPAGLDAFTNPTASDDLSTPVGGRTHSQMHRDENDAIEAIQAELGVNPAGLYTTVAARLIGGLELGTDDLDTITTPGYYYQSLSVEAVTNYPVSLAGVLVVRRNAGSTMVFQEYTTYLAASGSSRWWRNKYSGAWGPWIQVNTGTSGGGGGAPAVDPTSTQWIISPYMQSNRDGTGANMPSTARMFIPVASSYTVDQCAIRVNTGVAASTCTVTVYADSSGRPGSTLATSPAIDCSTSGTKTATFGSPPTVTAPGVWVGVALSDTATLSIKWASVTGPGAGLNTTVDRLIASSAMSAPENADTAVFPWVPRVALRRA